MKPSVKISLLLIGIIALSSVEIVLMYWFGRKDLSDFCNDARSGISIAQLGELAKKYDVRLNMPGTPAGAGAYVASAQTPRSFGRHTCLVRHDNNAVIGSQFGDTH